MKTPIRQSELNQAAGWLARLQNEQRRPEDEEGFRRWLEGSDNHRRAFDHVTTVWTAAGAVRAERSAGPTLSHSRRTMILGTGAVTVGVLGAFGWNSALAGVHSTGVGEQSRIELEDGSHILLDAATRLRVRYASHIRDVTLESGRANFQVVEDRAKPFHVRAGVHHVTALTGDFDVGLTVASPLVFVARGLVSVRGEKGQPLRAPAGHGVRIRPEDVAVVESIDVSMARAWRAGKAVFDDVSLGEAIGEMNRYSRTPLVLADAGLGTLRISGVYRTGDSLAFARSVALLLPVRVRIGRGRIELRATG